MLKDILLQDYPNGEKFAIALSPMDDITTREYRTICKRYGADVLFTEFVSSDALIRDVDKSYQKISFSKEERPVGIQIFGSTESALVQAAQRVEELNPDFIDINWGCPMKKIAGKGAGSGILADIPKMLSITKAVVKSVKLPVSVKTRISYDDNSTPITDFAEALQDCGIQLLSIHGRTKQQMYRGNADWTLIGKVKENPRINIPIFGNGDINTVEKFMEYKKRYALDGILIGRHAVGNPFFFMHCKQAIMGKEITPITVKEKVSVCKEHLHAMCDNMGESRAMVMMKKFYSRYFLAIPDFKPYKLKLMEAKTIEEIDSILSEISSNLA